MSRKRRLRREGPPPSPAEVEEYRHERELAFLMGESDLGWDDHGAPTSYAQPISRTKRHKWRPTEAD